MSTHLPLAMPMLAGVTQLVGERASKKQQGKWRNEFAALCGFGRQNSTVASYSRASSKLNKVRDGSLSVWIACFKAK